MAIKMDYRLELEEKIRRRRRRRRFNWIWWVLIAVILCVGIFLIVRFTIPSSERKASAGNNAEDQEIQDIQVQREEKEEEEEEVTPSEIELVMAGDMLMHSAAIESGEMANGTYNYDAIFEHTKNKFESADLAICNQETLTGGSELGLSGYPEFNIGYEFGDALVNAGFNVISQANNHAQDMGEEGLLNCLNFWESEYPDIHLLGIHRGSEEDSDPLCLIPFEDVTIGILNYTDLMNKKVDLTETCVDRLKDESKIVEDIKRGKEQSDFLIVLPHWGEEYKTNPSDDQKEWADVFLKNGVDLVIGAHPHVVEPVEMMKDDDGNQMLCYYSLGNFVEYPNTDTKEDGLCKYALGAVADVKLKVEDGEISIDDYSAEPVISHMVPGAGNLTVYFLDDYTDELVKESELSSIDSSFSIDFLKSFFKENIGDAYKEE